LAKVGLSYQHACDLSCSVAAGQLVSRLQLTWQGLAPQSTDTTSATQQSTGSFQKLLSVVIFYWCCEIIFFFTSIAETPIIRDSDSWTAHIWGLYFLMIIAKYTLMMIAFILLFSQTSVVRGLQVVFFLTSCFWVINVVLRLDPVYTARVDKSLVPYQFEKRVENYNPAPYQFTQYLMDLLRFSFWVITAIVLRNLRVYIRTKYAIPQNDPVMNNDCCCSCCCPCFVAGQMLRHTTDYNEYPATCCTETGIPPRAPSIV
jgi:hypothetical protein